MTNHFTKLAVLGSALFLLSGCIQEEPLNAEADILACHLSADKKILIVAADTALTISSITTNIDIPVMLGADLSARAPEFTLTEGATINPPSGSVHDFSNGKSVEYTVTSQDGQWKRSYKVSYISVELTTKYDFENFKLNESNKYQVVTEVVDGRMMQNWWGTGNPGYCLANANAAPTDYPTAIVEGGKSGKCLQLVTRSAGTFGALAGMPIAPGNLFLGSFDVVNALKSPLSATKFGVPFRQVPTTIKGYYKFKSGPQMTNAKNENIDGKDAFNIYAMFYENTDENGKQVVLDGNTSNNSPYNVLYGKIQNPTEAEDWTEFSISMESVNGKSIDPERLKNFGYNFALVFSSSLQGDIFTGAIGSTLMVDEVRVECK